jgi:hypothetical protein
LGLHEKLSRRDHFASAPIWLVAKAPPERPERPGCSRYRARRALVSSHSGLSGCRLRRAAPILNWLVEEKDIAPHIPVFVDMARPATSTTDRAESGLGRAARSMRATRFGIARQGTRRDVCPLKPQCCPKVPSHKIPRDIHGHARAFPGRSLAPNALGSHDMSARRSRCGSHT